MHREVFHEFLLGKQDTDGISIIGGTILPKCSHLFLRARWDRPFQYGIAYSASSDWRTRQLEEHDGLEARQMKSFGLTMPLQKLFLTGKRKKSGEQGGEVNKRPRRSRRRPER